MKTAISIPDHLFRAAERAAKRLGFSRSELYWRAVAAFLERQSDTLVTEALNEIYHSQERSVLDPVLEEMQRASLSREDW
jgi:metal-responsive CopG/Arc/MetJ family transcriptional regulator